MEYNNNEIEIFKRVIKDYKEIKKDIDKRIAEGYDIQGLYDYIRHLSSCDITNVGIEGPTDSYFDFNYMDMCLSVYKYTSLFLGDTIEVWNDKECYYVDTFNNLREIEDIVKEYENVK